MPAKGEASRLSSVVTTINLKLWARAAFHEPRALPCRSFSCSEGCPIRDELPDSQQQICCNNSVDQIKFLFTAQSQKLFLIAALRGISWLIVNVLSNVLFYKSLPMFEISSFLLLSSEMWNEDYLPSLHSSLWLLSQVWGHVHESWI